MAKGKERLPRALDIPVQPDRYRAGMYVELQKFGDWKGARQLLLSEAGGLAPEAPVEVTGLDLTVTEDKALSALQILLDRTDYKGNLPGEEVSSRVYHWTGALPRLFTTYSDYFGAYGLRKIGGRYQGHQMGDALEALRSLKKPRRIIYERKRWEGEGKDRKQVSDIIVTERPLIHVTKGYKGLKQEEAAQVKAGQDLPQRAIGLEIEFSPLLVDGIRDGFYLLKPTTLHQEIKSLLGPRRVSRAVSLFLQWLLTLNLPEMSIAKEKLAKKLRLDYLIEQRKKSLVDKRLKEAIQAALELGYLLECKEDAFGTFHFTLNPDRMGRPPKWDLEEEGEDEEAGS